MDERRAAAFEAALLPWSSDIEPDGREGCSAAIPFEQGKSKTRAKNLARRPIRIRLLSAPDYHSFRNMHYELFPVDYEEPFFQKAIQFQDGIVSMVAIEEDPMNLTEQLVAFISFKLFPLHRCDPFGVQAVGRGRSKPEGLLGVGLWTALVAYILTVGVLPSHRKQGLASSLIQKAVEESRRHRCRAMYLHVIQYNNAAHRLYEANGFRNLGCLKSFYDIRTGRQPDPSRYIYDAFFYAKDIGGTSVEMTPEALARVLLIPLRPALKAFGACSSTNLAIQGGAPHGFADAELGEPKFSPWAQSLKRLFS